MSKSGCAEFMVPFCTYNVYDPVGRVFAIPNPVQLWFGNIILATRWSMQRPSKGMIHYSFCSFVMHVSVADPRGGAQGAPPPPPRNWFNYVFLFHFLIRMLKNKTQIARESIKTTLELPGPLTLKKPGLLTPSHSRGGGGGWCPPPPRISAAERRKIMKFGTYVNHVETNSLAKFPYWKSKRFSNYANLC